MKKMIFMKHESTMTHNTSVATFFYTTLPPVSPELSSTYLI